MFLGRSWKAANISSYENCINHTCIYTCTYGDSWIDSVAGTTQNFIMWRGVVIWETGILEINPGSKFLIDRLKI